MKHLWFLEHGWFLVTLFIGNSITAVIVRLIQLRRIKGNSGKDQYITTKKFFHYSIGFKLIANLVIIAIVIFFDYYIFNHSVNNTVMIIVLLYLVLAYYKALSLHLTSTSES